jgi:Mce-associated membrane protein
VTVTAKIEQDSTDVDAPADGAVQFAAADFEPTPRFRPLLHWGRLLVFGVLPGLALVLAIGTGYLKWLDNSARDSAMASIESVRMATASTIALLSYLPDTVEKDLSAAADRTTGAFRDSYWSLIHDVVIPGAKQKQISAVATVLAVASVSATENHAVVLVFVDQTVVIGNDAPSSTNSSVRVTLDKIGNRWLISQFEPI